MRLMSCRHEPAFSINLTSQVSQRTHTLKSTFSRRMGGWYARQQTVRFVIQTEDRPLGYTGCGSCRKRPG